MTLIEQLNRLAEWPEVCSKCTIWGIQGFTLNDYNFWIDDSGNFTASYDGTVIKSRPALAWLEGALRQVIEARGMYWELRYWKPREKYEAEIANRTAWADTPTEALLAALIAALEGEG